MMIVALVNKVDGVDIWGEGEQVPSLGQVGPPEWAHGHLSPQKGGAPITKQPGEVRRS